MERLAKTSGDTYRVVVDHFAAQQERSVRFAQEVLDGAVREVWHQAESNRSLTQEELVERAEQQRDAYQELVEQSVDAYMDLLYAPSPSTSRASGSSRARSTARRSPSPTTTS